MSRLLHLLEGANVEGSGSRAHAEGWTYAKTRDSPISQVGNTKASELMEAPQRRSAYSDDKENKRRR